jgi:hypothetical protein
MRAGPLPRWPFLLGVLLVAAGLAAPAQGATLYALTTENELRRFDSATPSPLGPALPITPLQMSETIVGIDFRPQSNLLYGIGSSNRLYLINTTSGAATQVGGPGGFTPALSGTEFGIDFNPVPDRLRVVSDADQNLRLNPNDGTVAGSDSPLVYRTGDPNFGANPNVVGSAYTNNFLGATTTTLYGIDSGTDVLTIQDPPNMGQLATVGPLNFDFSAMTGFEVLDDGTAFAVSDAGASASVLYRINLTTGQATVIRTLPDDLRGLAGESTGAAGPFSGSVARGPQAPQLDFQFRNDGMRPVQFLRVELMPGYTVTDPTIVSGPSGPISPIPSGLQAGPFSPYWMPGEDILIRATTDPRYPDDGGANLFVCPPPCFGMDDGPFSFGGPSPVGGGTPDTGTPAGGDSNVFVPPGDVPILGDFNRDGKVDAADYVVWRKGEITEDYLQVRQRAVGGYEPADKVVHYTEWRTNFGRSRASQRGRARQILFARGRVTLRGGQSRLVRIPLTRAGKRLVRSFDGRRLRARLLLRVTYRPAGGAPAQRRTFRQAVRLRVVKPKRRG